MMRKRIREDLYENQRRGVAQRGHQNAVAYGVNTDVWQRLSPAAEADWETIRTTFTRLRCRIRGRYLGSNTYPDTPLFVLEVVPLEPLPTIKPPNSETPWHISVAFYNPQLARDFNVLIDRYAHFREYTLIGWIQGASFYLDTHACPIGSDVQLQELVRQDPSYGHKPIHISL